MPNQDEQQLKNFRTKSINQIQGEKLLEDIIRYKIKQKRNNMRQKSKELKNFKANNK